jgi:hypothetical protein
MSIDIASSKEQDGKHAKKAAKVSEANRDKLVNVCSRLIVFQYAANSVQCLVLRCGIRVGWYVAWYCCSPVRILFRIIGWCPMEVTILLVYVATMPTNLSRDGRMYGSRFLPAALVQGCKTTKKKKIQSQSTLEGFWIVGSILRFDTKLKIGLSTGVEEDKCMSRVHGLMAAGTPVGSSGEFGSGRT